MKILIINQHPEDILGGSELQCDIIAKYLTRLGHKITYFAVNGKNKNYKRPYEITKNKLNIFTIIKAIKFYNPDIIYWRFNKNKLLLSVITLKLLQQKIVFAVASPRDLKQFTWGHNDNFSQLINKTKHKKGLVKFTYFTKAIITLIFHFINYQAFYLIDGIIGNNDKYKNVVPVKKQTFIKNSMIDESTPFSWKKPFILWVANIKAIKNPMKFLELTQKIKNDRIDFLMVGSIQEKEYFKIIKEFEKKQTNFYYLGPKTFTEVNGILEKSLFLVHTCNPEGFPNNFIQAWLKGKPTISLYYDPDNIINSYNLGYISKNINNFVKDVNRLIDSSTLRDTMGKNAKLFAKDNFHPEKNIKKLEVFLKDIINNS